MKAVQYIIRVLNKFILGEWNVGIIGASINDVMEQGDISIRWVIHGYRDRYFADPFLYRADETDLFILVEELAYAKQKGCISLLKVDRKSNKLKSRKVVLAEETHLSYPFFNNHMVVPENYQSEKCCSYCFDGNTCYDKYLVMKHGLIDQTFLQYEGLEWIFATDKDNPLCGLKIYYRENDSEYWHEHKKNPVKVDIRSARPAGKFFYYNGTLHRPVQDSELRYGHRVRIMRIEKLTPDDFFETEAMVITAEKNPPFSMGFHTFNVEDGFIIVDGYRERHSFLIKPLCMKLPALMRLFIDQ